MRYFVTGGTGFIGGQVIQQLREAGHEVVALVRNPAKAAHLAEMGVKIHAGDITDKDSMRQPMTGADGVFHIAAWYKVGARDKSPAERISGVPAPGLRPRKEFVGMFAPLMDVIGSLIPLPEMYAGETLRSMAGTFTVTAEKARRELGFQARPLGDGLREALLSEMRLLGMSTPE